MLTPKLRHVTGLVLIAIIAVGCSAGGSKPAAHAASMPAANIAVTDDPVASPTPRPDVLVLPYVVTSEDEAGRTIPRIDPVLAVGDEHCSRIETTVDYRWIGKTDGDDRYYEDLLASGNLIATSQLCSNGAIDFVDPAFTPTTVNHFDFLTDGVTLEEDARSYGSMLKTAWVIHDADIAFADQDCESKASVSIRVDHEIFAGFDASGHLLPIIRAEGCFDESRIEVDGVESKVIATITQPARDVTVVDPSPFGETKVVINE